MRDVGGPTTSLDADSLRVHSCASRAPPRGLAGPPSDADVFSRAARLSCRWTTGRCSSTDEQAPASPPFRCARRGPPASARALGGQRCGVTFNPCGGWLTVPLG